METGQVGWTHAWHSVAEEYETESKKKVSVCVFSQDENSDECKSDSQSNEEKREAKV